MSVSTVAELIDSFIDATPDRLDDEYQRLVGAVWNDGDLTELSLAAVPELVDRIEQVGDDRKGHLAILLGMLAEAEYPATDGPVATAVAEGLDLYLDLWRNTVPGQPVAIALGYLLAHFPYDRERILAVAVAHELDDDDYSRLERALQDLDPENPSLGRVFPSPAVWNLDDSERQFDQAWIKALGPEKIAKSWQDDTHTVFGHIGAKAYWAVCNGAPVPPETDSIPPRFPVPPEADIEIFNRHADAFRCLECGGGLEFAPGEARCTSCSIAYPISGGILNLTAGVRAEDRTGDFQFKLAEMPSMGFFYEAYARPNFVRLCGQNFGGSVSPSDEDEYIVKWVQPVDGPVLDLAAGAGRWTEVLAQAVGSERVITLDLNPPMLAVLRGRLPELPAVMTSAAKLPFGDATLGAVLCWNALQAFPDDAPAAIAEVGRCLKPGGTFSFLTFKNSTDRIYRYFVASHHFPQHSGGLHLFELDDIKSWLDAAGLTVREESGPGTFVFITAERPAS